ncbi:MAG TPA: hypothetical protein VLX31_04875 [Streptosporangiaceae bacterium]|nr:hypothetical protein [Streptosporangiaceae bacterium]
MSPQSRRAEYPGGSGRPGSAGRLVRGAAAPPPNALFAEMLRAARELLAVRSPLDAELMVSELLGTWWRQPPGPDGRSPRRRRADIEELVGEGLVGYAAEQGSPAALALLSGIACLGTARQAQKAESAALELMEQGVARPGWAEHAGAVEAGDCYVNSDAFGDRDEVICLFSYAGRDEHALVVIVDYNAGGMIRDGWVSSQVGKLLAYCADQAGQPGSRSTFGGVCAPNARRLLESGLTVTEALADPPVARSFPSYHAFIRARIRTLPPAHAAKPGSSGRSGHSGHSGGRALTAPIGPGASRHQSWRPDRRAMLVAEFLASDEAEDLSDISAASRCTDHIVDYGCDRDFGRPLRVSPAKAEAFLLDWLPRKVMLTPAEQHAMPHVLVAWARWAGKRSGMDAEAIGKTLDAVFDAMPTFARVYHDPASFGLEPDLVDRLLPDRDLEALPRRAFAFGVLDGSYHGTDLRTLDPARPEDRRVLLAADHDDLRGGTASAEHLDRHLALTDRLWRGEPPELWDAAQRMLDLGMPRHDVVHALIDAIETAGKDERAVRLALGELPGDLPA